MYTIILELLAMSYPVILAAIVHMVIVKLNWFSTLTYPLDHYIKVNNKRLFGAHKTYRGLLVMVLFSILFTYLHYVITGKSPYNLLDYQTYSFVFYGVLFGVGYIVGELPNSFFKRQLNVAPGKANNWKLHLLDQVDSVMFIMLLLIPFSHYTWTHFWIGILFFGGVHLAINYILYLTGIRKESI